MAFILRMTQTSIRATPKSVKLTVGVQDSRVNATADDLCGFDVVKVQDLVWSWLQVLHLVRPVGLISAKLTFVRVTPAVGDTLIVNTARVTMLLSLGAAHLLHNDAVVTEVCHLLGFRVLLLAIFAKPELAELVLTPSKQSSVLHHARRVSRSLCDLGDTCLKSFDLEWLRGCVLL